MNSSADLSQWDCLRQNIGTWQGSFAQFSPTGEQVKDTPSVLTLEETDPNQTMTLVLERFPKNGEKKTNRLTFTAPGPAPAAYFFASGSFSQGSPQWSSFGQFATEFSLKVGDKRVRYVIMYEGTPQYTSRIKYVTLICETQKRGSEFVDTPLSAEQFLGDWQGAAEALCSRQAIFTQGKSNWQLSNNLALACHERFETEAEKALFEEDICTLSATSEQSGTVQSENLLTLTTTNNALAYQIMLLPKGAYCLLPQEIKKEKAFRIEVGWLSEEGKRTRFVRYYDTRGVWVGSALVEDSLG
ncbi:MAG: DUF3598 family protein [Cyanobacteria bacterium J06621_11]